MLNELRPPSPPPDRAPSCRPHTSGIAPRPGRRNAAVRFRKFCTARNAWKRCTRSVCTAAQRAAGGSRGARSPAGVRAGSRFGCTSAPCSPSNDQHAKCEAHGELAVACLWFPTSAGRGDPHCHGAAPATPEGRSAAVRFGCSCPSRSNNCTDGPSKGCPPFLCVRVHRVVVRTLTERPTGQIGL